MESYLITRGVAKCVTKHAEQVIMIKKLLIILLLANVANNAMYASEILAVSEVANGADTLICIGLFVFLSIITYFGWQQFHTLKTDIQKLSNAVNAQTNLLNQFEIKIRIEEQKRISVKLHNEIAGTLAAIKNNIDVLMMNATDVTQKRTLKNLSNMTDEIYNNVRNQSHEFYENAQILNEEMFEQEILHLSQKYFSNEHYNLKINIDRHVLENVSINLRTELVQIIQETFTNIIKHAQATYVELLIYQEQKNQLMLIVKDNGVGMKNKSNRDTIGIRSIKDRLEKYKGRFEMNSTDAGVEIQIVVPDVTKAY